MIDLHMHSSYSDGSDSPEEIIKKAVDLNLTQIAITDHNTLKGSIYAKEISPIDCVVGTELSVGYQDEELHLLGYFPNESNYKNTKYVIKVGEINKKIALTEMIENLNEEGYEINLKELKEYANGIINRVHICRVLMKHGYISSVQEGFEKLIGDHCSAYVKREYIPLQEAAEAIHKDGGIAVLAHPYNYKKIKDIPTLLNDVIDYIDGIECIHYSASDKDSAYLIDYANKHSKIITGGSDYHGNNKPNVYMNMMQVDDKYKIR